MSLWEQQAAILSHILMTTQFPIRTGSIISPPPFCECSCCSRRAEYCASTYQHDRGLRDNAPGGPVHVLITDEIAEHLPGCNMAIRKSALKLSVASIQYSVSLATMSISVGVCKSAVGRLVFPRARWCCIIAAIRSEDIGNNRRVTARQRPFLRRNGRRNTTRLGTTLFRDGSTAAA